MKITPLVGLRCSLSDFMNVVSRADFDFPALRVTQNPIGRSLILKATCTIQGEDYVISSDSFTDSDGGRERALAYWAAVDEFNTDPRAGWAALATQQEAWSQALIIEQVRKLEQFRTATAKLHPESATA